MRPSGRVGYHYYPRESGPSNSFAKARGNDNDTKESGFASMGPQFSSDVEKVTPRSHDNGQLVMKAHPAANDRLSSHNGFQIPESPIYDKHLVPYGADSASGLPYQKRRNDRGRLPAWFKHDTRHFSSPDQAM